MRATISNARIDTSRIPTALRECQAVDRIPSRSELSLVRLGWNGRKNRLIAGLYPGPVMTATRILGMEIFLFLSGN